MTELTLSLIEQAAAFLKGKIRETPVEFSPLLSQKLGVPVYLKLEFLQITGSFKARGGLFYLSLLSADERKRGVGACSAGNHGLGLANAAQQLGIPCTIFVPKSVEPVKAEKIEKLGAKVRKSDFAGYDDTYAWALQEAKKSGLHLVSAFDDEKIMASNGGSLAVEMLRQVPDAKNYLVPVGGGGLCGGIAYYVKEKIPEARIIACQHKDSPGLKLSLETGKAATQLPAIETVAGAIEGGLGEKCFEILKTRVDDVTLHSEEEIIAGFQWLLQNHQYLIEPSSAVAIASSLSQQIQNLQDTTIIVLTGRNVSLSTIQKLLQTI